jgi:hypothetical protein
MKSHNAIQTNDFIAIYEYGNIGTELLVLMHFSLWETNMKNEIY